MKARWKQEKCAILQTTGVPCRLSIAFRITIIFSLKLQCSPHTIYLFKFSFYLLTLHGALSFGWCSSSCTSHPHAIMCTITRFSHAHTVIHVQKHQFHCSPFAALLSLAYSDPLSLSLFKIVSILLLHMHTHKHACTPRVVLSFTGQCGRPVGWKKLSGKLHFSPL